ncbi:MAG: asparagine synthase (glutamine-hydrolyzing), partial [Candidatus Thorarchaeota archaeon]
TMKHRGPDGKGILQDIPVILGHQRLSIIDLSDAASQPMISANDRFVLVINGEIYNFLELRKELEDDGAIFRTHSDSEVLLEYFAKMGPEALQKFNGMFSFVIWDREKRQLHVARDRFGIKPLYYCETDAWIVFSSEIKAILPLLENPQPNDEIVYDFLASSRVDHLDETFFQGIQRFPAAHYGVVNDGRLKISRWYDIGRDVQRMKMNPAIMRKRLEEQIGTVRNLFFDAVKLRLRSDVPVGSCLSGGIDSSCVVAVATQLLPKGTEDNFQTYSAVYGPWFKMDERKYIEIMTNHTGTSSNFVTPKLSDLEDMFSRFMHHQEEPVPSPSPFTQFCVMGLAHSKGAKVLLDGQGGDEILGGYDYMLGYYLAELLESKQLWKLVRELFGVLRRMNSYALKVFIYQFLPKVMQRKLTPKTDMFLDVVFAERFKNRHIIESLLYLDKSLESASVNHIHFKLQHLLRWEDKNAMAFSIETRVPFLDHNLVSYILSLPSELKIRRGITKWILRIALRDLVPTSIMSRTDKIGFAVPEVKWVNKRLDIFLKNLKTRPHHLLARYVDIEKLKVLIEGRTKDFDRDKCRLLFRIMCLDRWLEVFFNDDEQLS